VLVYGEYIEKLEDHQLVLISEYKGYHPNISEKNYEKKFLLNTKHEAEIMNFLNKENLTFHMFATSNKMDKRVADSVKFEIDFLNSSNNDLSNNAVKDQKLSYDDLRKKITQLRFFLQEISKQPDVKEIKSNSGLKKR